VDPKSKSATEEFFDSLGDGLEDDVLDEFGAEDLLGRDIDLDGTNEWESI